MQESAEFVFVTECPDCKFLVDGAIYGRDQEDEKYEVAAHNALRDHLRTCSCWGVFQ